RSRQIGGPVAFEKRLRASRLVISEPSVANETRKEASARSHTDASAQPYCGNHQLAEESLSRPHRVLPEAVSSPRTEPRTQRPRMAAGVVPRPLRTRQIGDLIAFEPNLDTRRRVISEPSMAIERRKDASARFGKYSAVLIMCAGAAMFALGALYDPR